MVVIWKGKEMENYIEIINNAPADEPARQYYFIDELKNWYKEKEKEVGRRLSANIQTLGCQMNARDSEKIEGILREIGYDITEDLKADFVIYNTCTVRENANLKVYGRLGHLKKVKEKNPDMIIAMCGCMMQENIVIEKIKSS